MSTTTPGVSAKQAHRKVLEAGTDDVPTGRYRIAVSTGFRGSGKVTGHCGLALMPTEQPAPSPAPGALRAGAKRPAVVLLDGPVRETPYLEAGYCEQAAFWSGAPEDITPKPVGDSTVVQEDFPSHFAHATFIVGLVRQVAPDAHVVSVPVATADGVADEQTLVAALRWLNDSGLAGLREDWDVVTVLLPAGRRASAWQAVTELAGGDTVLEDLRHEIVRLGRAGVTLVTSAGNWGTDERAYPAWFAQDLPNVVAVGALDGRGRRAGFSSWGDWVRVWEPGVNLLSCTPFRVLHGDETEPSGGDTPGYATWSGSSFAAAVHAARLAQARAPLADPAASSAVEPTSADPPPAAGTGSP